MAKVLVVDDEDQLCGLYCVWVENLGHIAIQANNGENALNKLKANPDVKLIIADVIMPVMHGHELVKRIRQIPEFENIPILITSGVVGPQMISEAMKSKAIEYLSKPILMEELVEFIEKHLPSPDSKPDSQ